MATSKIQSQSPRNVVLTGVTTGKTFSVANGTRAILEMIGSTQGASGSMTIYSASTGDVFCFKNGLTNVTFDTSTKNELTVTGTSQKMYVRIYLGDISE